MRKTMTTFGKADARRKGSVSVGVLIYNLQARDGKEGQEPMMYGKRKKKKKGGGGGNSRGSYTYCCPSTSYSIMTRSQTAGRMRVGDS